MPPTEVRQRHFIGQQLHILPSLPGLKIGTNSGRGTQPAGDQRSAGTDFQGSVILDGQLYQADSGPFERNLQNSDKAGFCTSGRRRGVPSRNPQAVPSAPLECKLHRRGYNARLCFPSARALTTVPAT
jgi:hypothetical protein